MIDGLKIMDISGNFRKIEHDELSGEIMMYQIQPEKISSFGTFQIFLMLSGFRPGTKLFSIYQSEWTIGFGCSIVALVMLR
jgi:hypothetical protein